MAKTTSPLTKEDHHPGGFGSRASDCVVSPLRREIKVTAQRTTHSKKWTKMEKKREVQIN